jgi:2-phospho-L-lactate guanylyltransferase (CobY/MobA/RfbA family)
MTTVAVLADPPREGVVLNGLANATPLSEAEVVTLYEAMVQDVCEAVARSGGSLLVNFRDDADLPDSDRSSESQLRDLVGAVVSDPGQLRYEVQVGSTFSARAGNTVTHLLEREGTETVAVVRPTAPLLSRSTIDSAAMKLRQAPVVLGPAHGGRVGYAAFREPIEFEDAFAPPALDGITERAQTAGLDMEFLPMQSVVETASDLATAVSILQARAAADHPTPQRTTALVEEWGLETAVDDDEVVVERP